MRFWLLAADTRAGVFLQKRSLLLAPGSLVVALRDVLTPGFTVELGRPERRHPIALNQP
jgi:hypothetical protein